MSAIPKPKPERLPIVTDDDLRRLVDRRHGTAMALMLEVRKQAMLRGKLEVTLENWKLERLLGVDRRQLQRAKAYLRTQGFVIDDGARGKQGLNGRCSLPTLYVIDRRRMDVLRPLVAVENQEPLGGGTEDGSHRVVETSSQDGASFLGSDPEKKTARGAREGPPGSATADGEVEEQQRQTEPEREPAPPAATPERQEPPPELLQPALDTLREWWARRSRKSAGEGAVRRPSPELLDAGERFLASAGFNAFVARLAIRQFEREVTDEQLPLLHQPRKEP